MIALLLSQMWSDSSNEGQLIKDATEIENRYTQSHRCQTSYDTTAQGPVASECLH